MGVFSINLFPQFQHFLGGNNVYLYFEGEIKSQLIRLGLIIIKLLQLEHRQDTTQIAHNTAQSKRMVPIPKSINIIPRIVKTKQPEKIANPQ